MQTSKDENSAKPPFESSLDQLQQTVKKLESGELSLEDSLKQFEEGVRLTRICQEYLAAAEQRVELLMKVSPDGNPGDQPSTQPFPASRS